MNIRTLGALGALALLLAACGDDKATTQGAASGGGGGAGGMTAANVVPGSEEDLKANVGDRVLFDYDKSTLNDAAKTVLDRQSAWLGRYASVNVQIAGNCDERGTEEYNIVLGQRRAGIARDYLVAKGVASSRMTTTSYGKDRPVALGSDEESWKQNRNAITEVR